jgi:outer membrane protein TolC
MYSRAVALTVSLLVPGAATAAEPVTLARLLVEARARNPAIAASRAAHAARGHRRRQVTSLPDPRLTAGFQLESVETRVGPQRGALGLSQTFPTGGKLRLRGAIADQGVEVAAQDLRQTELSVAARVKRAFYEYWHVRRAREVTREMIDLVRSGEQVARTRYATGRATQDAVLKAQVELGVLEDRLQGFDELEPTWVQELLSLLGRDPGGELAPPAPEDLAARELTVDLDGLYGRLEDEAPAVRRLRAQAAAEDLAEDLARKARIPNLTVGVSWIDTDHARMPGTPGSGDDPVVVTLGVNLPVRRGRYRAKAAEHARQQEALERKAAGHVDELEALVRRAWFRFRDARRKMALYRESLIPKGRQALEATFASFQAGRASFLDLLDAERTLLDFELSHARARANHLIAIADLEKLVAGSVSRKVTR